MTTELTTKQAATLLAISNMGCEHFIKQTGGNAENRIGAAYSLMYSGLCESGMSELEAEEALEAEIQMWVDDIKQDAILVLEAQELLGIKENVQ